MQLFYKYTKAKTSIERRIKKSHLRTKNIEKTQQNKSEEKDITKESDAETPKGEENSERQ